MDDPLPWIVHMFFLSWVLNSHCFLAYHEIQVRIYKRALQESEELKELQGKLPQWRWQSLKGCSRQKCAACAKYEMGCDREQEQRLGNVFMLWTRMLRPKVRRNHCGKENEINRLACGNAYSQIHHIHRYAFSRDPSDLYWIYLNVILLLHTNVDSSHQNLVFAVFPEVAPCDSDKIQLLGYRNYHKMALAQLVRECLIIQHCYMLCTIQAHILGMASESRHKCPGWFILCPRVIWVEGRCSVVIVFAWLF